MCHPLKWPVAVFLDIAGHGRQLREPYQLTMFSSPSCGSDVVRLIAEVQDLNANVRQLLATTPQRTKTWIEPRELAALLGVSTRTIGNWREAGRFQESSYRPSSKGFQYHAQRALADAQACTN